MTLKEYLKNKSDKELIKEFKNLNFIIKKIKCYTLFEVMLRLNIEKELYKRKVII